jgi:hypothetical protein
MHFVKAARRLKISEKTPEQSPHFLRGDRQTSERQEQESRFTGQGSVKAPKKAETKPNLKMKPAKDLFDGEPLLVGGNGNVL